MGDPGGSGGRTARPPERGFPGRAAGSAAKAARKRTGTILPAEIFYVPPSMAHGFPDFRLLAALALFVPGLLALARPPTYHLWKLSVIVREAGHWLAVPCLALAAAAYRSGPGGAPAAGLWLGTAFLYASSCLRALGAARRAARDFRSAWGQSDPDPTGFRRKQPLSFRDLFLGVSRPRVRPERLVYARKAGLDLKLDFYRAGAAPGPAPCVLILHGGGWDGGSRDQMPALNRFLSGAGYAVAALDYRLAPRFAYPAPVEDVRDALAWLKARAGALGIDPDRFVLAGRSAGGQVALQAAYLPRDPAVKAVIAFYAPADMVLGYRFPCSPWVLDSPRLMENYLGASGSAGLAAAAVSSPLESATAEAPPTLLLHGRPDVLVTFHHTLRLGARLSRLGVRHFGLDLPWAPHGYDFVFNGPGSQISLYILERFLAAVTVRNGSAAH